LHQDFNHLFIFSHLEFTKNLSHQSACIAINSLSRKLIFPSTHSKTQLSGSFKSELFQLIVHALSSFIVHSLSL